MALRAALWVLAGALLVGAGPATLRVGTSADYPPFSQDGRGFDIEVAKRYAHDRGLEIEWVGFRWPELERAVASNAFDVAMSGVTWRPSRATLGYMTRAVAVGGPCWVGMARPRRIAVNRGGALEHWARATFPAAQILAIDRNLEVADRYRRGEVDAFVTDRFELPYVAPGGATHHCVPPRDRKVYWVSPAAAPQLGPDLDAWIAGHETELQKLRVHWLGSPAPRAPADHLIDLLARRLAFMPAVAAWKRAQGLAVEDPSREAQVLAGASAAARKAGLDPAPVRRLFRVQMELAKALQRRDRAAAEPIELARARGTIARLGRRIVAAAARARELPALGDARWAPLGQWLGDAERARLRDSVQALRPARPAESSLTPRVFRKRVASAGGERYSAWFADSDRTTLYFGLSPFWHLWWATGGDSRADLQIPGTHWIGRFSFERERFLAPLEVSRVDEGSRGSVWDVLVHSSGRIYYTTLFEEIGSVEPDGGDLRHYSGLGVGFNELAEGPQGRIYVTRYSDVPSDPDRQHFGSLVILSAAGRLLRERRFPRSLARFTAPKSLAVGPKGWVWLNTDTFVEGGEVLHERIHLAPDGRVTERTSAGPELLFPAFDREGRAWLVEAAGNALQLRIAPATAAGGAGPLGPPIPLGSRQPLDFVQDLRFSERGVAVLSLWSGRVIAIEPQPGGSFRVRRLRLELPSDCEPPEGRSLLYTAVPHGDSIYATLYCDATILRFPLQ